MLPSPRPARRVSAAVALARPPPTSKKSTSVVSFKGTWLCPVQHGREVVPNSIVVLQGSLRRRASYLLRHVGRVTLDGMPGLDPGIYATQKGPYPLESRTAQVFCGHRGRSLIGAGAIHNRLLIAGIRT